ncbi:MAG: T9SS type A sorting domain-containing protein [Bacteroidia bacterium]|nr:T9SS type A sorting domain-containing protein [Bacteroidia bacterium]
MLLRISLYFVFILFYVQTIVGQNCGYGHHSINSAYNLWYQNAVESLKDNSKRGAAIYDSIFQIPVVFHVIVPNYNAVKHQDILWMLNELNNDFRRNNADTNTMRRMFGDRVGDTRIEFYLATEDPNGVASIGYETKVSTQLFGVKPGVAYNRQHGMKFDSLGGLNAWDTKKYLNIWVCNLTATDGRQYLAGFSTAPPGSNNWNPIYWGDSAIDGVVMDFNYFSSRYNSVTLTHEVGHFLGLRHVSGDPQFILDTCKFDDGIFETPKVISQNFFTCDFTRNTCIEPIGEMPDMIENFMDYSTEYCKKSFTLGQITLMRSCLLELRQDLFQYKINSTYIPGYLDVQLYPNPNSGQFNIANPNQESFELKMYDLTGRLVLSNTIEYGDNYIDYNIGSGIYFIIIENKVYGQVKNEKLVIVDY